MRAAIVDAPGRPPHYGELDSPTPGRDEVLVEVVAAGLHPRVRSGADGTHYASAGGYPLVPGVDGVGRLPDGGLVYFVAGDAEHGTMAEQAVLDPRRSVPLPDGLDPVVAAAAVNPAMSSWVALQQRADFQAGRSVLVLGATGTAGQLAVQVARRFGAGRVVAAGRNAAALAHLVTQGAAAVVPLGGDDHETTAALAAAASEVDVVLDYLWGAPAEVAMGAVLRARADRAHPLTWIQIGATAGPDLRLPSPYLRSAALTLVGCGQGSVTAAGYLAAFPDLLDAFATGALSVHATAVPLAEVARAWTDPPQPAERLVLVP